MARAGKADLTVDDFNPLSAWGKAQMLKKRREEYQR